MPEPKIMITGSKGFIGINVKKAFKNVVEFDVAINKIHNIFDRYMISEFLKKEKPQVVIHLAANAHPPTSIAYPPHDLETNILGTVNLLECCKEFGINHFIYSSSAVVYGQPRYLPINENHPINPSIPYGISKFSGELYCKYYHKIGVPTTILRFFNIYGESQPYGYFVPDIIKKIKEIKTKKIELKGSPQDSRDFLHVEDLANCIKQVVIKKPFGQIFNVGGGKGYQIKQVAEIITKILNKQKTFYYNASAKKKKGTKLHADIRLAKKTLNWKPKISLYEGLKRTIDYYN